MYLSLRLSLVSLVVVATVSFSTWRVWGMFMRSDEAQRQPRVRTRRIVSLDFSAGRVDEALA